MKERLPGQINHRTFLLQRQTMKILHLLAPKAALAAVLFLGVALASPAACLAQEGGKMAAGKMADSKMAGGKMSDAKMSQGKMAKGHGKMAKSKMSHDKMGKM